MGEPETRELPEENPPRQERRKRRRWLVPLILLAVLAALALLYGQSARQLAAEIGAPSAALNFAQKLRSTLKMGADRDLLLAPASAKTAETLLEIDEGDGATSIANKLDAAGALDHPQLFVDYLIYSGGDRTLKPGKFVIPAGATIPEIKGFLTNIENRLLRFVILPGMRLEEIADLLPSSGLQFSAEAFLAAAQSFIPAGESGQPLNLEGYLLAGTYEIHRNISLDAFLNRFYSYAAAQLTGELQAKLAQQGVTAEQAVILASMVTREAMMPEEYPLVASVFLNRARQGMKFQSDPTVQYTAGWDAASQSWWKNPLTLRDLETASPFNTYQVTGFPPHAIGSFPLSALRAVADAPTTDYLYFRLKCDGTAFHNFAVTYEEHVHNECPSTGATP